MFGRPIRHVDWWILRSPRLYNLGASRGKRQEKRRRKMVKKETNKQVDLSNLKPGANLRELFECYKGQPACILCMRYWYRGIVSLVGEDFVILTNARAIEQTGAASGNAPGREDIIPAPIAVKFMSIELITQLGYAWLEMESK